MLIAIRERMDHQVVEIAQSVEHRSTNPKVMGSIPTLANKIFHSFLGVCGEQFFIRIHIYHSDERDSSII